jgi:hypothetical protein
MPHNQIVLSLINVIKAINLFVSSADQLYGPITMLRRDGRVAKKVPWTAFALSGSDWTRVLDAKRILAVRLSFSLTHHMILMHSLGFQPRSSSFFC